MVGTSSRAIRVMNLKINPGCGTCLLQWLVVFSVGRVLVAGCMQWPGNGGRRGWVF